MYDIYYTYYILYIIYLYKAHYWGERKSCVRKAPGLIVDMSIAMPRLRPMWLA